MSNPTPGHSLNDEIAIHEANSIEIRMNGYCIPNTQENRREIQKRVNMHEQALNLIRSFVANCQCAAGCSNCHNGSEWLAKAEAK